MVGFGLSLGDIAAIVHLIHNVCKALNESRGSAAQVGSLVQLLKSVGAAIEESKTLFTSTVFLPGSEVERILQPIINGIATETQLCYQVIENFMNRSRSHTEAFLGLQGKRVRREWKKITWCLFHDKDMRMLQSSLQCHLAALNIYNVAYLRMSIAEIGKSLFNAESVLEARFNTLSSGISSMNKMPRQLGWVWEGGSSALDAPVRLYDAFGSVELLPWVFFSSAQMLHDILKILYRNTPGRLKIMRKQYVMIKEDSDSAVLNESNWVSAVKPGMQVSLNMVFKAASSWDVRICPRCKSTVLSANISDNGPTAMRRCHACKLRFRVRNIEVERFTDLNESEQQAKAADQDTNQGVPSSSDLPPAVPKQRPDAVGPSEQDLFQLIHYDREILKWRAPDSDPISNRSTNDSTIESPEESKFYSISKLTADRFPPVHRAAAVDSTSDLQNNLKTESDINARASIAGKFLLRNRPASKSSEYVQFSDCTPLHVAAWFGSYSVAKWLLDHGADKELKCGKGKLTPIHYACQGGHLNLVTLFLEGAASLQVSASGWTLLHSCAVALKDDDTVVKTFLRLGLDSNSRDTATGQSPLFKATTNQNLNIATALLDSGANVDELTSSGCTPLMSAAYWHEKELVDLLLSHGARKDVRTPEGTTPLLWSLASGSESSIPSLMCTSGHLDSEAQSGNGLTALMLASYWGNDAMVGKLSKYVSINEVSNKTGCTALMVGAQAGHEDVVQALIDVGASTDSKDHTGSTALTIAATYGRDKVLKLLLTTKSKATINWKNKYEMTALSWSAWFGHTAVVELLLSAGALVDSFGEVNSPLLYATKSGQVSTVKMLLVAGAKINYISKAGWTALKVAAAQGHETILGILLAQGADIDICSHCGWSALHNAAYEGHSTIVTILLSHGAGTEHRHETGFTALIAAASKGHTAIVASLLAHGASADARDKTGYSPLDWAAGQGHVNAVELLLKHGVDPNTRANDSYGFTPFLLAAIAGHITVMKVLAENGADINLACTSGHTALTVALCRQRPLAADFLISQGFDCNTFSHPPNELPLILTVQYQFKATAERLLEAGVKLSRRNLNDCCALDVAARYGRAEMTEFLLSKGADANFKSNKGISPLQQAVIGWTLKKTLNLTTMPNEVDVKTQKDAQQKAYLSIVKALLDWGADPDSRNDLGRCAIHYAAYAGERDLLKILQDGGADADLPEESRGWTALHHAAARDNRSCIDLLLDYGAQSRMKTKGGETFDDIRAIWNSDARFEELQEMVLGDLRQWV